MSNSPPPARCCPSRSGTSRTGRIRACAGPAGRIGGAAGLGACRISEAAAFGTGRKGLRPHRSVFTSAIASPRGGSALRRNLEIYSRRRPIQKVTAGDTLRILDEDRFEVVWSMDGWKTTHHTPSRGLGSAGFSADLEIARDRREAGELSWTLHWTGQGPLAWLQCASQDRAC